MIHGVCQAESPKPSRPHFSARTLARRIVGDIKLPIRRHRPPPTPWARPARPPPTTRGTVSTRRLWGAQGPHSIDGRVDCRVPRRGDLVSTDGDTCLYLSWIIRARAVPCIGSGARDVVSRTFWRETAVHGSCKKLHCGPVQPCGEESRHVLVQFDRDLSRSVFAGALSAKGGEGNGVERASRFFRSGMGHSTGAEAPARAGQSVRYNPTHP